MSSKSRAEKYNFDLNSAMREHDADMAVYSTMINARKDAVSLAAKLEYKDIDEFISNCESIYKFVTEGVDKPQFKVPENPVSDSGIVNLAGEQV